MPTAADLQTRFPETFANTPAGVLNAAIAEAYAQEDAEFWGARYETAVLYQAAHLAILGRTGGATGIQSATAGPTSTTFAQGAEAGGSRFLDLYEQLLSRNNTMPVFLSG